MVYTVHPLHGGRRRSLGERLGTTCMWKFLISLAVICHIFKQHAIKGSEVVFNSAFKIRWRGCEYYFHVNRLKHPYIVKRNAVMWTKHAGPL